MLHGRRGECDALEGLLADARRSRSGALVVRGEAELPFAALHQLLRPVLGLVDGLPAPQVAALAGVLGLGAPR
jgi:hypothetical protein